MVVDFPRAYKFMGGSPGCQTVSPEEAEDNGGCLKGGHRRQWDRADCQVNAALGWWCSMHFVSKHCNTPDPVLKANTTKPAFK
jgi:hypothetical protein